MSSTSLSHLSVFVRAYVCSFSLCFSPVSAYISLSPVPVSVSPSLYLCYAFALSLSLCFSLCKSLNRFSVILSICLSVCLVVSISFFLSFSVCAVCASCYRLCAFLSVRLSLTCLFLIHSCKQTQMVMFRKRHVLFYFNACTFEEAAKYQRKQTLQAKP